VALVITIKLKTVIEILYILFHLSAKSYDLFSKEKKPVEVAIALNLRELEVTKMYREYWKLKRLHNLDSLYEEIGDKGTRI
jgi:hypothetical protein